MGNKGGNILPVSVSVVAVLVIFAIILGVFALSFIQGLPGVEYSVGLDNFRAVLADAAAIDILLNTVIVGVGTVLLNLFFAVPMAWLFFRTTMPVKTVLLGFIGTGIAIPSFLKAMGWIVLLSPQVGVINALLMRLFNLNEAPISIYGLTGVILVQGLMLTPVMFFLIAGAMQRIDPSLEEAAESCGTPRLGIIRRITAPLLLPAISGAALYNFMLAVHIYEVPAILAVPAHVEVISTVIFQTVMQPDAGLPRYGVAAVYGLMLVFPLMVALRAYLRVMQEGFKYGVITGKGYRPNLIDLGRLKYLGLAFVLLYVLLAFVLPFAALVWCSLLPFLRVPSIEALSALNLDSYRHLYMALGGFKPIVNSALLMAGAPALALFMSLMISWVLVRLHHQGAQLLDTIVMLPMAVPGVVVGVVTLYLVLQFVQPLHGTLWLLIFVQGITMITYGTRIMNAALVQVHIELEEAAYVSGAKPTRILRTIVAPLIAPSLLLGGFWMSMMAFHNVTLALLLYSPENVVVPVRIWVLWREQSSMGAALGVVVVVALFAYVVALQRLARKQTGLYALTGA
jgi:iron(III) transport system permease protein